MEILRRIGLWLSRTLFQLELIAWISVTTIVIMVGSPAPLKQTLKDAKFYDRLPDIVLKQSQAVTDQSTISLGDKTVTDLVKSQFPASKLQAYTENVVDGVYDWLSGKTAKPDFKIDLGDARVVIAEGVAQRAVDRLKTLPPCTQIPAGQVDPFSIQCRPPGIDLDREKQQMLNEILANKDFLPNTVITADQLPKDAEGQTLTDKYSNLPKIFGLIIKLPLIIGVAGALTAAAVIWLSLEKRRGVRSVGRMVLATGTFVLVTTVLFGVLMPKLSETLQAHFVTGDAAPLMNDVLRGILQNSNKALYITSGSLTALGAVILLGERFVFKAKKTAEKAPSEQPAEAVTEEKPKKELKEKTETEPATEASE